MKKEFILDRIEKVTYVTPASPVVLVSTRSIDGINNLAPFGMFMVASTRPNMIIVAISSKSDTHRNIIETQQFVVGIPKKNCVDALYASGGKYPPEVDEFVQVGFTPYESRKVAAPKISECIVNLECHLAWHKEAGNHTIFCADVVDADIDEGIYKEGISILELRKEVSQLYHITSNAFISEGDIVQAKK